MNPQEVKKVEMSSIFNSHMSFAHVTLNVFDVMKIVFTKIKSTHLAENKVLSLRRSVKHWAEENLALLLNAF
jgi:hypothetical protein